MPNQYELVGRNAFVTGAGMGIGLATARLLAENGAKVVIHSLAQGEAEEASRGLRDSAPVWGDLADPAARESIADRVAEIHGGRLDVLVHNAGIYPRLTLETESLETYRRVMNINVESQWHLTKRLLAALEKSGHASVVIVSSIVVKLGMGDSPAYTASKAAQIGLARHLASELGGRNIRVNLVMPGQIDTPGSRAQLKEGADELYRKTAKEWQLLDVILKPEDVAHAAAFFSSTAARGLTGAMLDVNGGWRFGA